MKARRLDRLMFVANDVPLLVAQLQCWRINRDYYTQVVSQKVEVDHATGLLVGKYLVLPQRGTKLPGMFDELLLSSHIRFVVSFPNYDAPPNYLGIRSYQYSQLAEMLGLPTCHYELVPNRWDISRIKQFWTYEDADEFMSRFPQPVLIHKIEAMVVL